MKHSNSWQRWLLALMFLGVSLLALTAHAQVNATGRRLALVMGNDAYQNVHKLERAGNDAAAMARELKAAGFDVTLERDLNYRSMVKKVDFFTSHITGGDQVVIFFAGHGVQLRSGSYLLPIDIEANSESEVEKTAIALNDVMDKLNDAKASFSLVMIDACRDNPLKSGGRSLGASRGLLPPDPPKGQMVVYSASKGQQALDKLSPKDTNPNGVFTREFIARMRKPGVRIEDLVREVQDSVEDLAKSIGHDQRPALYNEARGNFYFYGPTRLQVQGQAMVIDPESETWSVAERAKTAEAYQAYLDTYPQGRYVVAAKIAINLVKTTTPPRLSSASSLAPAGILSDEADRGFKLGFVNGVRLLKETRLSSNADDLKKVNQKIELFAKRYKFGIMLQGPVYFRPTQDVTDFVIKFVNGEYFDDSILKSFSSDALRIRFVSSPKIIEESIMGKLVKQHLDQEFAGREKEVGYPKSLEKRRNEELAKVYATATVAIKKLAQTEGYDLVLQEVVFKDDLFDVTNNVLNIMNSDGN